MKRMTLPMIGIAALWLGCSQAPPPKMAPTTQGSHSRQDSDEATPDLSLEEGLASPVTTPKPLSPREELAQLRERAHLLAITARMPKEQLESLERIQGADPAALDKALSDYLFFGESLSALRLEIIAAEARLPGAKVPPVQDQGAAELSQRETEERILTLTALVTELQVDYDGKKAVYGARKKGPNSTKKSLREARRNYRECAEQLWTLKEKLAEAKAEQQGLERLEAERRQRAGEPRAESRFRSQESEQTMFTLTALVTQLQKDMLRKKAIFDALSNVTPNTLPITAELQNLLDEDPFIYQLEQRLQTAEEELKAVKSRFGDNHRVVKGAQVARGVSADRVQEERTRKIVEYQRNQIEQAKRNFLEAQEQLVTLRDRLMDERSKQLHRDALRQRREVEQKKTPPTTTRSVGRRTKKLVELREEETKLAAQFQASTKKYDELNQKKGVKRLEINSALDEWLKIGWRLSSVREKIVAMEAQLSALKPQTEEEEALSDATQREGDDRILTLTALVIELQVDYYGKQALYDALKNDPNSTKKLLQGTRKNYREAARQLWTLREALVEERERQREHDVRYAKKLMREKDQQDKEPQTPP